MTVFFQDGKRGFLNVYTGKIVIPAQYDRAWVFSEGVGAVVVDNMMGFVDKRGEFVIAPNFPYDEGDANNIDFLFKDGCCPMRGSNGKQGLIDKSGQWVVEPQYDHIGSPHLPSGIRVFSEGELYGFMDRNCDVMVPAKYQWAEVRDYGVFVFSDGVQQQLDFDCRTVLNPFLIDGIEVLQYETDEQDSDGYSIRKSTAFAAYNMYGYYGLFNLDTNRPVTKAIYGSISAVCKNLFECEVYPDSSESILIDSKGEIMK